MKIAEKNDYLQITPPALWSLDDYATWCGSCELLEGNKVKIVDHMKKRLEKTKNNIHIKNDIRKKATDLYEDFSGDVLYVQKIVHRIGLYASWNDCLLFLLLQILRDNRDVGLSQGTVCQLEDRLFVYPSLWSPVAH